MTPCETELEHLMNLCAPPYRDNWIEYVTWKARGLAKHYPEDYQDLPRLLQERLSNESGPDRPSTNQPKE